MINLAQDDSGGCCLMLSDICSEVSHWRKQEELIIHTTFVKQFRRYLKGTGYFIHLLWTSFTTWPSVMTIGIKSLKILSTILSMSSFLEISTTIKFSSNLLTYSSCFSCSEVRSLILIWLSPVWCRFWIRSMRTSGLHRRYTVAWLW